MNSHLRRTALALGIVGLITTGCLASDPSPSGPAAPRAHGWQPLPESPLGPRSDAHAFWTGERVLVIGGGGGGQPCPPNADCAVRLDDPFSDGAAFDPSTDEWAEIAPAPIPLGQLSGAIVSDVLYLFVDGSEPGPGVRRAFLAYHVRDDSWVELEAPPIEGDGSVALVAAGDRVVAYRRTQEQQAGADLVYDPSTDTWTDLPPPPLARAFDRSAVWTGRELLMVSLDLVDQPNSVRPSLYRAAAFDFAAGAWRRMPDSEVLGWSPTWFWSGDRLVNPAIGSADGGEVNNFGRAYPFGGIFDVGSGAWSNLPDPPAVENVLQGVSVGGAEDVVSSEGFVLDVPTSTWTPLAKPRDGLSGMASVWAGDRLFVWGGVRSDDAGAVIHADGWTWQP